MARLQRHLLILLATALLAETVAAGPIHVGPEFRVNTVVGGFQQRPGVAGNTGGVLVIAWPSGTGLGTALVGRRIDAAGVLGPEFEIMSSASAASAPGVAVNAAGGFMVVEGQGPLYARVYDPSETALGPAATVDGQGGEPSVAAGADGNFLVVWQDYSDGDGSGIAGRLYDALTGAALGPEFAINTVTADGQIEPVAAPDGAGGYVVVWSVDTGPAPLRGQRLDASGTPVGGEFLISPGAFPGGVAERPGGGFVVAFGDPAVRAQRYDATGALDGPAILVNPDVVGHFQEHVRVSSDPSGRFFITWTLHEAAFLSPKYEVRGRFYKPDGTPAGPSFRVNATEIAEAAGIPPEQETGSGGAGQFLAAWTGADSSERGVLAQRYGIESPISGARLVMRDPGRLVVRSTDVGLTTVPGATLEPVANGAFLHVFNNDGTGESACYPLPAAGWTVAGSPQRPVFRYLDRDYALGPCRSAQLKRKLLKASCNRSFQPMTYTLDEAAQVSVGVELVSADAKYCAVFGGLITEDVPGSFSARAAGAPAPCPTPPASCP